ncbi:TetR/AcrR family transcriptional regulator [soil metagenome]
MTDRSRKLRKDAAENLDRLLDVATAVFAEEGFDTSIEVIARRADVGLGTIYRRFASKAALIDELARRLLASAVEIGERHVDDAGGEGLVAYFWEIGALLASQHGIVAKMWKVPGGEELIARSRAAQGSLLANAQRHGIVRAELVAEDVAVLCWSISGVLDVTRGLQPAPWRRHLELCVAGLRPSSWALREKSLAPDEMDAIIFGYVSEQ